MKRIPAVLFLLVAFTIVGPKTVVAQRTHAGGVTVVVTSEADSGTGSLRAALADAQPGNVIRFDPGVFPPDQPATIRVLSELPHIHAGGVTLDASDAGVVLDGHKIGGDWVAGLQIVGSSDNVIRGLTIQEFSGPAISLSDYCSGNEIAENQLIKNGQGIDMNWAQAVGNTIAGNLIGTDETGLALLGNHGMGIQVGEYSTGNTIGPYNVIAYNGADGLYVHPAVVDINQTTLNSVFGNFYPNQLVVTDEILVPPAILDFDFSAGRAVGAACANCQVRLFSTETGMEFVYEGETSADGNGDFSYAQNGAFQGPAIMTQAISPAGRFSTFSEPLTGDSYMLELQSGNGKPRILLPQIHSRDLTDNRISAQFDFLGLEQPIYDLDVYPMGVTRSRIAVDGIEPDQVIWDLPELSIHPLHDAVIDRMVDNGVAITYVLMFWDKARSQNGRTVPCYRFETEDEIERFLEYVRFIVGHFKGRVEKYEIWNEPDIADFCPKSIHLADYARLIRRTIPVIRETDPEAKVVIGAVSNMRFDGEAYLLGLLRYRGIARDADVISFHPNYGASLEYPDYAAYYRRYQDMLLNIKSTAEEAGFDGEYQADEITYRTHEDSADDQPWTYSTIASNKYFLRTAVMHLGLDMTVGLGTSHAVTPRLCTVMDEARPTEMDYQIRFAGRSEMRTYTFESPGDAYLLGVWREGIVDDFDPGVPCTVEIRNIEVDRVTVIDMLHGVEQELLVDYDDGGNLLIKNLMVKDYPLMIKLWDARFR